MCFYYYVVCLLFDSFNLLLLELFLSCGLLLLCVVYVVLLYCI